MPPTCSYYYIPTYLRRPRLLVAVAPLALSLAFSARGIGNGLGIGIGIGIGWDQPRLIFLHTKQFEFTEIS